MSSPWETLVSILPSGVYSLTTAPELKISDLVILFTKLLEPYASLSSPSAVIFGVQLPKVGSLDKQHQLGTCCSNSQGSPRALVLCSFMWLSVRCGHRKRHRRHSDTLIILAASRNRKLASQGGHREKAQSGGRSAGRRGSTAFGASVGKLLAMVFSLLMCGYESWTVKRLALE